MKSGLVIYAHKPPGTFEPPEVWGPRMWAELENHAKNMPARADEATQEATSRFMEGFSRRIPCLECMEHWKVLLAQFPPAMEGQREFRRWASFVRAKTCQNSIKATPPKPAPCCGG